MGLFSTKQKVNFKGKTNDEIVEIYNSLSKSQQFEITSFLSNEIMLIISVAEQKGIPLDKYNLAKENKDYDSDRYFGLTKFTELEHVFCVITFSEDK